MMISIGLNLGNFGLGIEKGWWNSERRGAKYQRLVIWERPTLLDLSKTWFDYNFLSWALQKWKIKIKKKKEIYGEEKMILWCGFFLVGFWFSKLFWSWVLSSNGEVAGVLWIARRMRGGGRVWMRFQDKGFWQLRLLFVWHQKKKSLIWLKSGLSVG